MNSSIKCVLILLVASVILIGACTPVPAPTQDPAEIQRQIDESVALTVAAQNASTEQHLLSQPSNTPLSTQTEPASALDTPTASATGFVFIPNATDTPRPTNTKEPTRTPGITNTPRLYSCSAFGQSPGYQVNMKPGEIFDVVWVIVNNGTKTWAPGVDVKFSSGTNMTGKTFVEIPVEIQPNDRYTITLNAKAPSQEGVQYMTWVVEGQLCFPSVIINVVK